MRVVVLKAYTDKYTGVGHVPGEKLDITEERFTEIQEQGKFLVDISDEVGQKHEVEQGQQVAPAASSLVKKAPVNNRRSRAKKESEDK